MPSGAHEHICAKVDQLPILGMAIPPLVGNLYNWYVNPYYWVNEFIPYYMELSSSHYWKSKWLAFYTTWKSKCDSNFFYHIFYHLERWLATPISIGLSWPRKLFATELGSGDRHRSFHYGVSDSSLSFSAIWRACTVKKKRALYSWLVQFFSFL